MGESVQDRERPSKTREQIKKEKHSGREGNEEQQTCKAPGHYAAEKELALQPRRWLNQKCITTQAAPFRTHIKEPGTIVFIIPALGRWRQETPWDLLAS